MGILSWIIIGAIAGVLASYVVPNGFGLVGDTIIGILGGFVGGFIFNSLGEPGMTGLSLWSIFVAFIGAVVLLYVLRFLRNHSRTPNSL